MTILKRLKILLQKEKINFPQAMLYLLSQIFISKNVDY
ncbi:hypothetical protein LACWKB8_1110 [Lactobacillus sp. wkB8]|nr:hypothetical protein LACWKB8_1110 [Lactobacillus sp. wkB8]